MQHLHAARSEVLPQPGGRLRRLVRLLAPSRPSTAPLGAEPAVQPRTTGLLRRFSLLSLLCVAGGSTGLALVQSRFLEEHLIRREADITVEYLNSIVRA